MWVCKTERERECVREIYIYSFGCIQGQRQREGKKGQKERKRGF